MNKRLKKYPTWLSAIANATGISVLPNQMTAFSFVFSGSALLLLLINGENKQPPRAPKIFSALDSLIGIQVDSCL